MNKLFETFDSSENEKLSVNTIVGHMRMCIHTTMDTVGGL